MPRPTSPSAKSSAPSLDYLWARQSQSARRRAHASVCNSAALGTRPSFQPCETPYRTINPTLQEYRTRGLLTNGFDCLTHAPVYNPALASEGLLPNAGGHGKSTLFDVERFARTAALRMDAPAALDRGHSTGVSDRWACGLLRLLCHRPRFGALRAIWSFDLGGILVDGADRHRAADSRDALLAHVPANHSALHDPQERNGLRAH